MDELKAQKSIIGKLRKLGKKYGIVLLQKVIQLRLIKPTLATNQTVGLRHF
jgi:hypothetical protein